MGGVSGGAGAIKIRAYITHARVAERKRKLAKQQTEVFACLCRRVVSTTLCVFVVVVARNSI